METRFLKPPKETKIALKNWVVREIGDKIAEFNRREVMVGSSY